MSSGGYALLRYFVMDGEQRVVAGQPVCLSDYQGADDDIIG
jgi:hypothetical protein